MPAKTEVALSPEPLGSASSNYLRCLNLPPSSQVLIITDKFKTALLDQNCSTRVTLSAILRAKMLREGHRVVRAEFDNSLSSDKFKVETRRALEELEESGDDQVDRTTTIIYLGEEWNNRSGMYEAAEAFGKDYERKVRWAGSLGFSVGDARVMTEMTSDILNLIYDVNREYSGFFKEHPQGSFKITTRADNGEHVLNLRYDSSRAPFESDVGQFDEDNKVMISDHVQYVNIPGGEKFTTPYPFKNTYGEFAAEGILFTVQNGLVVSVKELEEGAINSKEVMQKKLIELVLEGKEIPVSELGLGFYAIAGIETYPDGSILSKEKGGPHIGFGNAPGMSSEAKEMETLSGDFYHVDFVLDKPVIKWADLQGADLQDFYPPKIIEE